MNNKAILMSIQPRWVVEILNGNKTIEVRKKFPKDYVGWVYIYCTKNGLPLMRCSNGKWFVKDKNYDYDMRFCYYAGYNGKVVARFWCDKVEEIENYPFEAPEHPRGYRIGYDTPTIGWYKLLDLSCLKEDELFDYLGRNNGYALHIKSVIPYEKPRKSKKRKESRYG